MKRTLTLAVALLGLMAAPALAEPEVFSKAGYKADQQAAIDGHKLQIAYFTATWCPPCKKMKAETWVDEDVESWIDANAVITPVDIDQQPAYASQYRVRSIPTTVVILGDKEIGRTKGYMPPEKFLEWLDGYRVSHLDPAREKVGSPVKPAPGASADTMIAPAQADAGLSAQDTMSLYIAEIGKDSSGLGLTGSVLAPRLAELASADEKLRAMLAERVQILTDQFKTGNVGVSDVREYIQLAPIAGKVDEAAAWIQEQLASPRTSGVIERNKFIAAELLSKAGKYAEATELVGDPVRHARMVLSTANKAAGKAVKDLDASLASAFKSGQAELVRRSLADAVVMAQVAGEQAKAKAIAKLFPDNEVSKSQHAIDAAAQRAGVEPIQISDE